jgi:hypothetical protein
MTALVNGGIDIDTTSKKLNFIHKDDTVSAKKKIELERIKNMDYYKVKQYLKGYEEINLTNTDYREIEKNINEDKKICENCKTNIYENNFHKGWKNDQGEFVLLCSLCSKKYFNGALEIIFDGPRRDDGLRSRDIPETTVSMRPSFAVINTNETLLQHKRGPDRELDILCANKKCNRSGKKSDFLCCSSCEKFYHANCLDTPMILKFVNRFKWLCLNCKTCQQCGTSNGKLIKCNTCDRTFHDGCYPMHISFGKTHCGDCITCKNCNKALPLLTISNQNDLLQIKGYRVCEECWKYYKNVSGIII